VTDPDPDLSPPAVRYTQVPGLVQGQFPDVYIPKLFSLASNTHFSQIFFDITVTAKPKYINKFVKLVK
jgi:hypothetical protein